MIKKYILAHDLGTSGNKASIYDDTGNLVANTFYGYNTMYPKIGWVEQKPNDWWEAVIYSTKDLLVNSKVKKEEIACVVFSGQMMSALPVDKNCTPLSNSIIWADTRSVDQANQLKNIVEQEEIYKITGHRCSPNYSATKIMWLRDNKRNIYDEAYKFLHVKDFIVSKLTSAFVTDFSDASGMNLLNINDLSWSSVLIEASKIDPNKLPDLHASTDIVGEVSLQASKEIDLLPGTPVVIGGGDGSCAAMGAGIINEGSAYNYIGSSSWIGITSNKPIFDKDMSTFNWVHLDPKKYCPTGTMQAAGGSYSWLKENLCPLETKIANEISVSPYKLMDLEAELTKAGSDGLIYLPYILGERSPYWNPNARGAFIGLSQNHTRNHIIRSVLEGITFNLKIILEVFESQLNINSIKIIGGGAKGQLWRQIMADIYEKTILVPQFLEEATSLGAAVAGGIGIGFFKNFDVVNNFIKIVDKINPIPENSKKYREIFPIFKECYSVMVPIFDKIACV
ncbi:MAG: FGGY-family carbohydrate kinase [Candidatus Hydromicrobium sp.]|nr:FGGY-family carbohydrate kinase [Candidatus Hydromicrobium sp.]